MSRTRPGPDSSTHPPDDGARASEPRREHLFVCGELASADLPKGARALIAGDGAGCNLTIDIEGIGAQLVAAIPPVYIDLLLNAAYVLTADQAIERGKIDAEPGNEAWRRRFRLRIPVQRLDVWGTEQVRQLLENTLNFLSDDYFTFEFVQATRDPLGSRQLTFTGPDGGSMIPWTDIGTVMMFSGGLDSFTGAFEQVVVEKKRPVLVSHRSSTKMLEVQRRLIGHLAKANPDAAPLHVAVEFKKQSADLKRERTQRTRSFLYAALGATVARLVRRDEMRFYENGIVTFNLPVSPQLVGSKATRTTHPRVLRGFADLFAMLDGRPFAIENPFIFKTRAEVMKQLVDQGGKLLMCQTVSCAHVHEATLIAPHCGVCSQCVDRRFAAETADAVTFDPVEQYDIDILHPRRKDRLKSKPVTPAEQAQRLYLVEYVRTARKLANYATYEDLLAGFGEANRALSLGVQALSADAPEIAAKIHDLHRRYGLAIEAVIGSWLKRHWQEIADGKMDGSFLTSLVQRPSQHVGQEPGAESERPARAVTDAGASASTSRTFRREGSAWRMRFPGGADVTMSDDQAGYVHIRTLLQARGDQLTPFQLEAIAEGKAKPDAEPTGIDRAFGTEELADFRAELADLPRRIRAAEDAGDDGVARKLSTDRDKLDKFIKDNTKPDGSPKVIAPERDKARKRIAAQITRAITAIKKEHHSLGIHLQRWITKGFKLSYDGQEVDWLT